MMTWGSRKVCFLRASNIWASPYSRMKGEAGQVMLAESCEGRLQGNIDKGTISSLLSPLFLYLGLIHHSLTPAVFTYTSAGCIQIRFKRNPADLQCFITLFPTLLLAPSISVLSLYRSVSLTLSDTLAAFHYQLDKAWQPEHPSYRMLSLSPSPLQPQFLCPLCWAPMFLSAPFLSCIKGKDQKVL